MSSYDKALYTVDWEKNQKQKRTVYVEQNSGEKVGERTETETEEMWRDCF